MLKKHWPILLAGLLVFLIVIGWYVVDNSRIGFIDYHLNESNYRIIAEAILKETDMGIAYGKIYLGNENVCDFGRGKCPEKYSKVVNALLSSNITHASYIKHAHGVEIATIESRNAPFYSDLSERYYIYDPENLIESRILQNYGDGWKLSYNYTFDISPR